MNDFGRQVADLRRQHNLSQATLAVRAGTDASSISRYESGARQPERESVLKIAEALGLDAEATDRLLVAAGFLPVDVLSLIEDELVHELAIFLADERVPNDRRERMRVLVSTAMELAGGQADGHQSDARAIVTE